MDTEAPAETQDQPVESEGTPTPGVEPGAPEVDVSTAFEENFDPQQLPPELQPAYKQMQGAFTKKTQSLAEQRQQAESAMAFMEALQSDDHRGDALAQLAEAIGPEAVLEALGMEIVPDVDEVDDDVDLEDLDPGERALRELQELRNERERETQERAEAEAQAAREAQLNAWEEHTASEIKTLNSEFKEQLGGEISEGYQQALVARALYMPQKDGMPDIRGAFEALEGEWTARQQRWIDSKKGARPAPDGQPGAPDYDWTNENERIDRMAAIIEARRAE